jgi:hypothetical protein
MTDLHDVNLANLPAGQCFLENAQAMGFFILAVEIVRISLSPEHGGQRKKSSDGFANSDWTYKCSQTMSEPIRIGR